MVEIITKDWIDKVKDKGYDVSYHGYSGTYVLRDDNGQVLVYEHVCFNSQDDRGLLWVEYGRLKQSWFSNNERIHKDFKRVVERLLKMKEEN